MGVSSIQDPFNTPKTVCPVCRGDKKGSDGTGDNVNKPDAVGKCAFCNGTGQV